MKTKYPETYKGNINLFDLESAESIVLPKTLNGDLRLNKFKSAEGLILPTTLNGKLYLNKLTSAKYLVLPTTLNGKLYLYELKSAESLILPENFKFENLITSYEIKRQLIKTLSIKQLQSAITDIESLNRLIKKTLYKKIYGCRI